MVCADVSANKLGVAFACSLGAGLASVLGAVVVLFMPRKNDLVLAASLGFAAGVMLYISLVDIYAGKAVDHFEKAGFAYSHAFTYATLCFFGGFPLSWVLDKLADYAVGGHSHAAPDATLPISQQSQKSLELPPVDSPPVSTLYSNMSPESSSVAITLSLEPECRGQCKLKDSSSCSGDKASEATDAERARQLVHMGLLAALAVGIHNMPEGLVTFVGYMDSFSGGITTAVAIAIHNIPEGLVVASAVYFGTGNRVKALLWASLSAVAEPFGALIGLAVVCTGAMTSTVFGILFGLISGIMVYISLKELLPGSRQFDPHDRVSTYTVLLGMAVMASSLIAIAFSQPEPSLPATGSSGVASGTAATAAVASGGH